MAGHECYHCKQWIEDGVEHDCWTTTEHALTKDLSEDLQDAYERIRETAVEFGEQRIYASHNSIMFSRKACYFFVRPKQKALEVVFFVGRTVKSPLIKKAVSTSKVKVAHLLNIVHRDQVEAPLTDWLQEAYGLQDAIAANPMVKKLARRGRKPARKASLKPKPKSKTKPKPKRKARR
jgi:hypothetical protein